MVSIYRILLLHKYTKLDTYGGIWKIIWLHNYIKRIDMETYVLNEIPFLPARNLVIPNIAEFDGKSGIQNHWLQ
jgi:hypothetical protein